MRSVYDNIKSLFTLRPQAITANTNGGSVDALGYNSAALALEVGAVSGTSPTLDVKLQESADNSAWSDVTGTTFTQVTAANNSQIMRVEGLGTSRKRYLRVVATVGGTSPNFTAAVNILLGRAYRAPTN